MLKRFQNKKISGQILVIVLMVILLLSIIIMGIIAVVNRDLEQSLSAEQYETSYNSSETKILELVEKYGDVSKDLRDLATDCGAAINNVYTCSEQTDDNVVTEITVEDTSKVEDFELGKDETLKLILNDYRGQLDISWTGQVAFLITLEYQDASGTYKNIKDVYDRVSIYSQSGGASDHAFNFTTVGPQNTSTRINLGSTTGLVAGDKLVFLKLKAIMKTTFSTLLTVDGEATFPKQVRKFEGITYAESSSAKTAAPILITQIPLAGFEPGILNYVLESDVRVRK